MLWRILTKAFRWQKTFSCKTVLRTGCMGELKSFDWDASQGEDQHVPMQNAGRRGPSWHVGARSPGGGEVLEVDVFQVSQSLKNVIVIVFKAKVQVIVVSVFPSEMIYSKALMWRVSKTSSFLQSIGCWWESLGEGNEDTDGENDTQTSWGLWWNGKSAMEQWMHTWHMRPRYAQMPG